MIRGSTFATAAGVNTSTTTTMATNVTTTTSHISTLQAAGLFIPAVRAIVQEEENGEGKQNEGGNNISNANSTTSEKNGNETHKIEFSELSAGTIADLAHLQFNYREQTKNRDGDGGDDINIDEGEHDDDGKKQLYYEPLKPMELPISCRAPHIEPGRVDIRLMSLMDSLRKI